MKKVIIYSSLFTLILASCNSEEKKLERQYGALLQKEYAELENSDRYKQYTERYALLTDLSKQVSSDEKIEISAPENIESICFIPEKEQDMQLDQSVDDKMAKKTDARPFSELINLSKEVNATIIASAFHTKESGAAAFEHEKDYHLIADILNKDEYFANRLKDTIQLYQNFNDDRILMDRVNNSRYILIQKDLVSTDSQVNTSDDKKEFKSGAYEGIVYVYDIQAKKFINFITIGGSNSDVVQGQKSSIEFSVNSDLYNNISKALEQELTAKFNLKGKVPGFYKP